MTISAISEVVDKYEKIKARRIGKIEDFQSGKRPYLVSMTGSSTFYHNCNSIEDSFNANIADFENALDIPSDTLPHLEPWFGTGVYAEAFGCEYFWRQDESPAVRYAYKTLDEVKQIKKPSWRDGTIFKMVLDAIAMFKDRTEGRLPIALTDTQSAHDTATLILDATEVFVASYSDPETLRHFLGVINSLIIEFSRVQAERIGDCLALPGHIMSCSAVKGKGISISDDNLAVASPKVNEEFLLPYDDQLGEAFGGVAIHSCGNWGHSMNLVAKMKNIMMIDCAIAADPNPTLPEAIRDSFEKTNIIVQVRVGAEVEKIIGLLDRLWSADLRLIVRMTTAEAGQEERQYTIVNDFLREKYGC